MPSVIGPLFSISASGLMGKALLFYDTEYGARVRSPKKKFVPPGNIWEVNIDWFKKASARWKTLTVFERRAWNHYSLELCDIGRDLFMGRQIEMWNISPLNDVTFPPVGNPTIPDPPKYLLFKNGWWPAYIYDDDTNKRKVLLWEGYKDYWQLSIVGVRWYQKLDDPSNPTIADLKAENYYNNHSFNLESGHNNYLWYEFLRWDGSHTNLVKCYNENY